MYVSSPQTSVYSPTKNLGISRSTNDSTHSPYLTRTKNVTKTPKKVTYLHEQPEHETPAQRAHHLEVRIRHVDEKITSHYHTSEEKLNEFTDALLELDETLATEIIAREVLDERKVKEMRLVESNIALDLKTQKQDFKESERKVLCKLEQNVHNTKLKFTEEQRRLEDLRKENTQAIEERLAELSQGIKEEINVREKAQYTLTKDVNTKIAQFQENLDNERRIRHKTEEFLLKKIQDVSNGLQNQVDDDREARESTEAMMLTLLEEAINKLEGQITPRQKSSRRYY